MEKMLEVRGPVTIRCCASFPHNYNTYCCRLLIGADVFWSANVIICRCSFAMFT